MMDQKTIDMLIAQFQRGQQTRSVYAGEKRGHAFQRADSAIDTLRRVFTITADGGPVFR